MTQLTRRNLFAGAATAGAIFAGSKSIVLPAEGAAPAVGKQNAGWYRYKVGDFEVTVVTDGMDTKPLSDSYRASCNAHDEPPSVLVMNGYCRHSGATREQ